MAASPRFLQLANEVRYLADVLAGYAAKENMSSPSLEPGEPTALWSTKAHAVTTAKSALKEAIGELSILVNGPLDFLKDWLGVHFDLAALYSVLEFKALDAIPLRGSASLESIAASSGLEKDKLGRMLRLLACQRFTCEVADDEFAHTVTSAALVEDPELRAQFEMQLDEMHKASVETVEYFKSGVTDTSHDSPFKFRHGKPFYEWYEDNQEKGARFALAQQGIVKLGRGTESVHAWMEESGAKIKKFVDVGAGSGHVALELAKIHSDIQFTNQDLSQMMFAETSQSTPPDVLSRVTFAKHDFFTPQPIDPTVDAYLLRSCLHNWGDEDCVRILRGFVPALEASPRTCLLINEMVIPRRGTVPLHVERKQRSSDVAMFVIANSRTRSEADFQLLLQKADPRLQIVNVVPDPGMAVLQVQLIKKVL